MCVAVEDFLCSRYPKLDFGWQMTEAKEEEEEEELSDLEEEVEDEELEIGVWRAEDHIDEINATKSTFTIPEV